MAVSAYTLRVSKSLQLTEYIYNVYFGLVNPSTIEFKSGQRCLFNVGTKFNNYSICTSTASKNNLGICVDTKPNGAGSQWIRALKVGDIVNCKGPLGNFVLSDERVPKIFLATGTGVSPIHSMILTLVERSFPRPFYLFFGIRGEEDIFWKEEFESLVQKNKNFRFKFVLSQASSGWEGERGYVQDVLVKNVLSQWSQEKLKSSEFYLCGNSMMIGDSRNVLAKFEVSSQKIFTEKFF